MNKILFLLLIFPASLIAQNVVTVQTGGEIKTTAGAVITLQNMDLVNHGTILQSPGDGSFVFSGNQSNNISGSSQPSFNTLEIAKSSNVGLHLFRSIGINTSINFTSGLINLNNNTILLQPNAVLNGESETSRIVGGNGGFVEIVQNLVNPSSANPGNLGAIISSSQNLGSVIIRRGHRSQTNAAGSGNSILRYYDIIPTNNTALNATLRFNYLDAELNGLSENGLVFWKSTDNIHWTNEGFTLRDVGINYVEETGIAGFSRWTLSSPGNPLPVEFIFFNTLCENGKVLLTWKTAQEFNSSHFNIERSANGSNWTVIGTVPAAGNSTIERTYQFSDNSPLPDGLYRIAQHDLDGNNKYSIIVHSSCDGTENMKLWPNPAQVTAWLSITTNTGMPVQIRIYDSKGSLVHTQKATLSAGSTQVAIPLYRLSNGMYEIIAEFKNGQTKTFKLIKN